MLSFVLVRGFPGKAFDLVQLNRRFARDPRQTTLAKDLRRLAFAHGLKPGRKGEVTKATLMCLLHDYESRLLAGSLVRGSVDSYLSAQKAMHVSSGIDWTPVRYNFSCSREIKKSDEEPEH